MWSRERGALPSSSGGGPVKELRAAAPARWVARAPLTARKARISRRRCHATANRPRLDFHDVWLMMIVKLLFQRLG